jgi:hypothetical protein
VKPGGEGLTILVQLRGGLRSPNRTVTPVGTTTVRMAVIKCIYLPPTYLHFIQHIEDRCLLLTSSTSFVDLPFQEHRMMEKHHMDQNPCISSLCPKERIDTDNMP